MKKKGLEYDHESIYPHFKCLSSSQVITYYEDPSKFFIEYVVGVRKPTTQAMHIGSVFSAMYADRKFKWREALKNYGVTNGRIYNVLSESIVRFPVIPKSECEYPLKCKYRGWEFRATLDGYYQKSIDIENKTGQTVWDQDRCDESIQVTFQYWVKWKKDKCLFSTCVVNWIDLRASATQFIYTFETTRTIEQLEKFQSDVIDRVIDGIEIEDWSESNYKPKYY